MAEHGDGLAEPSMEACLQTMYQHDSALFGQRYSTPPASARSLADTPGLASHALQPSSATCGHTVGTSSSTVAGTVADTLCGGAPLSSQSLLPGSLSGFAAPGTPRRSHVRPQRPAWLEEAAQRMAHGIGLCRRCC